MSNEKDMWRIKTIVFGIMASFILIFLFIGNLLRVVETDPFYQLMFAFLGGFLLVLGGLSYNHMRNESENNVKNSE